MPKFPSRRRLLLGLTSVALLTSVLSACGSSNSTKSGSSSHGGGTVTVGYISTIAKPYGIEGWAEHLGIYQTALAKVGITNIQFVRFANGPDAGAAQSGGSLDVASVGDTPGISTKASGIDTRLVGIGGINENAFLLTAKNGPTTLAQLKGKKVATALGSYMDKYLIGLLKVEGLTKSVTVVNLLPGESVAALQGGQIAAYAEPATLAPVLVEKDGLKVLDEAKLHPDLTGTDVVTATASFLSAHPGFVAAWNEAFQVALKKAKEDPKAFYAFQAQANEASVAQAEVFANLNAIYPTSALPQAAVSRLEGTAKFLVEQKLQKKLVDIKTWLAPGLTPTS